MKKKLVIAAVAVCALFCAGCRTFSWGHDCKKNKECTPICIKDLAAMQKNEKQAKKNWERFKRWDIRYIPQKGCPELNHIGTTLDGLAKQYKKQVVIPFVELDNQGLISNYKYFIEDVNVLVKSGYKKDAAIATVYEMWLKKYGREKCEKLFAAIPLIRQMQLDRQLQQALVILLPQLSRLIIKSAFDKNLKRWGKVLEREIKTVPGMVALGNYIALCTETAFGIAYVEEVKAQNAKELSDMEAALNQCKTKFL